MPPDLGDGHVRPGPNRELHRGRSLQHLRSSVHHQREPHHTAGSPRGEGHAVSSASRAEIEDAGLFLEGGGFQPETDREIVQAADNAGRQGHMAAAGNGERAFDPRVPSVHPDRISYQSSVPAVAGRIRRAGAGAFVEAQVGRLHRAGGDRGHRGTVFQHRPEGRGRVLAGVEADEIPAVVRYSQRQDAVARRLGLHRRG